MDLNNIFENLIGTFAGAILAFISAMFFEWHKSKKDYTSQLAFLKIVLSENFMRIQKIEDLLNTNERDIDKLNLICQIYSEYKLSNIEDEFKSIKLNLLKYYGTSKDGNDSVYVILKNVISLQTKLYYGQMYEKDKFAGESNENMDKLINSLKEVVKHHRREYEKLKDLDFFKS